MNVLRVKMWAMRQRAAAVFLAGGAVITGLCALFLIPMTREAARLRRETLEMERQLQQKDYMVDEVILKQRRDQEEARYRATFDEWNETLAKMTTFSNVQELAGAPVGVIDFKVALYDVRQRLVDKARAKRIALPRELGMDDSVQGSEDPRRLMMQLRTIEKMVDMIFDLGITNLRSIEPLPPVRHSHGERKLEYIEEYPVRLDFFGRPEHLRDLFSAVLKPEHFFVLRRFRVESVDPKQELLRVNAVLSGLVFLPDSMKVTPPPAAQKNVAPMGH